MLTPSVDPVLVVGSGPSGLILALTLAKNGVPVRIIEKDPEFHVGQRGAGLQPRTLEVYHFLGVLPDILLGGFSVLKRCMLEMPDGRKPARIFDLDPPEEPTPSVPFLNSWAIGQSHNEEILRSHLAKHNIFVQLNTELVGFEQNDKGVSVHIVKHDGSHESRETVQAAFLVGADGAKSTVRQQLGLTFLGETREGDRILLADVEMEGLETEHWYSWGDHQTGIVYLRRTEYEGVSSCMIFNRHMDLQSLVNDHQALFKYIRDATNRHELEFGNVIWISEWRHNIRMVNKFGEGRVFVVGDAAHVHPPTGAQGLNTGVQDSYNLAWKLSAVYKGFSRSSLLDSYTTERLPVSAEMLGRTTTILNRTVQSKAYEIDPHIRPKILHQLGVNCRWSPIVVDEQTEAKQASNAGAYLLRDPTVLYAGDRAPDAPGLINFSSGSYEATSLFKTFSPTYHTALIFSASVEKAAAIVGTLVDLPSGLLTKVVVMPERDDKLHDIDGADQILVDRKGHAQAAYPPVAKGFSVIIVRPDGVVGAIVKDAQGANQYFAGVFASYNN